MKRSRCDQTIDLFSQSYAPETVAPAISPERVKTASLRVKTAKALDAAIRDDRREREELARELSDYLDEPITVGRINDWASEAKSDRNIPAYVLIALTIVLNSEQILNALLEYTRLMVTDRKYERLIARELKSEIRDRLEREIAADSAAWKAER